MTLVHPVTHEEVTETAASLCNYCARGPDGVPNELVKYACQNEDTAKSVAHLLNSAVEGNFHLAALGDGLLIPIQKAGKPRGQVENLRPGTLLPNKPKIYVVKMFLCFFLVIQPILFSLG